MKFARVRLQFPADPVLPVHAALADSEGVDLVRLRFGGISPTGPRTYVMSVVGDPAALAAALDDTPEVVDYEIVEDGSDRGIVYVSAAVADIELAIQETFSRGSLVMTTPIDLYPDGNSVFRVLGDPADLQAAIESARERLSVAVERIGEYDGPSKLVAAGLTDRQEETVRTALDLGYYDVPRGATHEDVADALGCAPATVSEHLQKAEAALVRGTFESG